MRFGFLSRRSVLVFLLLLGFACPALAQEVPTIETQQLDAALHSKKPPFLLDVREPSEVAQGYIAGAINIPLGELPDHLSELPKDRTLIVYCRSGHRSAKAVAFLRSQGFDKAESLTGGMNAWAQTHQCDPSKLAC